MGAITVIAKPKEARKIMAELLLSTDYEVESYFYEKDEIYITLFDGFICCDSCKTSRGEYVDFEDDYIVYLLDNCSSAIIPHIKSKHIYEININDSLDDTMLNKKDISSKEIKPKADLNARYKSYLEKCNNLSKNIKKLNDNTEKNVYIVNGKKVSKDIYEKASNEIKNRFDSFDDKFTDMIRDSLLFQCSYRDLYNQLLKDIWN